MKDKYTPREVAIEVLKKAEQLLKEWHGKRAKKIKKGEAHLMANEPAPEKQSPKIKGSPLKLFLQKRELKKSKKK